MIALQHHNTHKHYRITLVLAALLALCLLSQYLFRIDAAEAGKRRRERIEASVHNREPRRESRLDELRAQPEGQQYEAEEIELLARVINAEMGANWVPDEVQRMVGSVVLNRVRSEEFPDTMYGVVYQRDPVQYACPWNGSFDKPVTEKVWANTLYLIEHGSVLPPNVYYQSTNAGNGTGIYDEYYDPVMKNTTYFCYG